MQKAPAAALPGKKEHVLVEVADPNLYREQFPYSEIPKIMLDGETVPLAPAEDIWIRHNSATVNRRPHAVRTVHLFDLSINGGPKGVIRQTNSSLQR
jgi:hypothetical protein